MNPRILIVEDEAALVTLLRYNLEREGYTVAEAANGEDALMMCREAPPDLVLLDWMVPLVSGVEVCRRLRRAPETRALPIIMLTARGEEDDRVRGLDAGADDYVTKPFAVAELMARVRAALRRGGSVADEGVLVVGDIEMDLASLRVRRAGTETHLGPTEFRLLRHFMTNPGRVFSREQLLNRVWGHDAPIEPRTVDVHIRRLRKAINAGGAPDLIRTVRSAGYSMEATSL
ncbi:MAG: phosphate regulon transcriptional regulator PhoB [Rhodospirillaceae bacterium]|jgi:two-component system, OmpR family, phosphate regulon response regulator PhoB|nr:phosphate regulon transcriptional regulator PhoB [Rhodospirillaceae bacterium]MBT6139337.1 phosphate regulon transcriptional regulator PhoB [Rhodospirillaceae bacterium]